MRLVSFGPAGQERPGVIVGDDVVDLCTLSSAMPSSVREILAQNLLDDVHNIAGKAASLAPKFRLPLKKLRLGPAITNPSKIVCLGLNYADHAEEQNKPAPESPMMFLKGPNALAGHGDAVPYPRGVEQFDYEVELAFVMGKRARRVAQKDAYDYVAGYSVFMDLTARDLQAREKQWFRAKSTDGSGPLGPWLITRDEIANPHALAISLSVNDEPRQSSRTDRMTFTIDYLIHYISQTATLEPGDVIATGTPAGVGVYRQPPTFLRAGDRLSATIEGIGTLSCRIE